MSDVSKKFSIHSSFYSIYSFLFPPKLLCTAIRRLNHLGQASRPSFADWMGVIFQSREHFGLKFVVLKMLKTWVVMFLRLMLHCWPVIALFSFFFFKRYSLIRAALFFLNTSYFFGFRYFLLSLSVFFSCGIAGLIQITFFLPISSDSSVFSNQ